MNKQESQNLMIGSWVLAGGEPRQVSSLTTKKAGFKRGTSGHRDFFRFDQLQGIPLSEELLKECITYRDINPKEPNGKVQSLHCYSDTVIALHTEGRTEYHRFRYLHEVQAFLTSLYQMQVVLDMEKYKFLMRPEMIVTKKEMNRFRKSKANLITKEIPNMVLEPSFIERLKEIGTRPCACNPAISGMPTLGEDKRGFKEGMLTYKE